LLPDETLVNKIWAIVTATDFHFHPHLRWTVRARHAFLFLAKGGCERRGASQRSPQRQGLTLFESPAEAAAGFTKTATDKNLAIILSERRNCLPHECPLDFFF
jgi:hypothetical protein